MPVVYDLETYPNFFSCSAVGCDTDDRGVWEISERRDDRQGLIDWLWHLSRSGIEMVGFNNIGFDYPIIHYLLSNPTATYDNLYEKAQAIIKSGDRFAHTIWPSDRVIPQIDLFKVHHFDNVARSTSLKALQIAMRSPSVVDLPYPAGTLLTPDQMDVVLDYNDHDVDETKRFWHISKPQIDFRREVSQRYGRDFMNHNDTKIGKDYFVQELERVDPTSCYERVNGTRIPRQTKRPQIALADVILPYVRFDHPEFNRILAWFQSQVISETKGVFTDISCTVDGFQFDFGVGGIHGSVTRRRVFEDADHAIIDLDVTSYYPSIAIVNKLYPAHLGQTFCAIYADVMAQRKQYAKGTPENAVLKLALNGVYGDSNNPYSPFYDPQYTMAITINGQLLLCMLAEKLMSIPDLEMIQINTDGLTVKIPRRLEWLLYQTCQWWETTTGLALEENRYSQMFVRDENNYLAVGTDGKIKRKGAYETAPPEKRNPLGWHQDTNGLVIPKAAEAWITKGIDPHEFIAQHTDPFDFMLRAKVKRNVRLMHGDDQIQGTSRYYVSIDGQHLRKISPPPPGCVVGNFKRAPKVSKADYDAWHRAWGNTWSEDIHTKNKSVYAERTDQICKGWETSICNVVADFDWSQLNRAYYVAEAQKLIESFT